MLRFTTAGESHGPALVSVLEGLPAGIPLLADDVNVQLARRQAGYDLPVALVMLKARATSGETRRALASTNGNGRQALEVLRQTRRAKERRLR